MVRDRKSPEVRRAEILDAAERLLVRRGIDAVSIADIAQEAGAAKGLLYHYFESKDDLIAVLRERYLSDWYSEIERLLAATGAGDEEDRFARFLRSMYEFHADKIELHHLLLGGEGAEHDIIQKTRKLLLEFVRLGVRSGRFSVAKLEPTVDFILNGLHGLLVQYLHEGRPAARFGTDALAVTAPLLGIAPTANAKGSGRTA